MNEQPTEATTANSPLADTKASHQAKIAGARHNHRPVGWVERSATHAACGRLAPLGRAPITGRNPPKARLLAPNSVVPDILLLSAVMLILLLGNCLQMAVWAGLYVRLGEFNNFSHALYFSGVTFATLGYGDVVLSEGWRLLSALEAANGILMFGVSTAVMTAAVSDVFKHNLRSLQGPQQP